MSAEYIKLWTAFLDDDWVQSLSCTQRGVFIQLLLTCRKNGDISTTYHRSARTLAGLFGLDVGTLSKTLRNFDADGKIKFSQDEKGVYRIEVCNYHFWQGLKGEKGVSETVKKRRSDVEKSVGNRPSKPSQEKPSQTNIYIAEIISDLNSKSGKTYQPESAATVRLVTALLNRKFTVDQFKHVHTVKCAEWLKTDMEKYLRPSTLYGSHFEEYLNQGKSTVKSEAETKYEGVTING